MESDSKIEIKPAANQKQFQVKQSKYKLLCENLPTRALLCAPSGSGKTVLLQQMIMNLYDRCFSRIFIFSPSVNHDSVWEPVKDYIENTLDVHETEEEQFYYDHYDPDALEKIIETQTRLVKHMKAKGQKKLYQILIIIDDFSDAPEFSRKSQLLHSLYTRGRHSCISTITSTQKLNAIHPIIRLNATELFIFRLRNYKDIETFLEETSALLDKKTLLKIYQQCTAEPYSFLYVKLTAKTIHDMFYCNLNQKITFNNVA